MQLVSHEPTILCIIFLRRDDDFEAQMNPFDFLRQEMLRPFESECFKDESVHRHFAHSFIFFQVSLAVVCLVAVVLRTHSQSLVNASNLRLPTPHTTRSTHSDVRGSMVLVHFRTEAKKESVTLADHNLRLDWLSVDAAQAKADADKKKDMFEGYTGRVEEI